MLLICPYIKVLHPSKAPKQAQVGELAMCQHGRRPRIQLVPGDSVAPELSVTLSSPCSGVIVKFQAPTHAVCRVSRRSEYHGGCCCGMQSDPGRIACLFRHAGIQDSHL